MQHYQLCSGLLIRGDRLLLVRCRYPGEDEPLWTLPGGRQERGETIEQTVAREFREETSLVVSAGELAYVSESFDAAHALHVLNCTFFVDEADPAATVCPLDTNVVEARFVPIPQAPALLEADVLRVPVSAALEGRLGRRYFAFSDEQITVPFLGRANRSRGPRG